MISRIMGESDPPERLLAERFKITAGFHPGQRDIIEQLVSSATGWKAQCDLECTIRITKPVREPRNEMRQKLAYSNAGVSKVECPECATTRSLDGPLGDSTIPFPPKTKNQDLISKVRILKVLVQPH